MPYTARAAGDHQYAQFDVQEHAFQILYWAIFREKRYLIIPGPLRLQVAECYQGRRFIAYAACDDISRHEPTDFLLAYYLLLLGYISRFTKDITPKLAYLFTKIHLLSIYMS